MVPLAVSIFDGNKVIFISTNIRFIVLFQLLLLSCLCASSHSFPDNKPIAVHGQSSPARWNRPAPWKQSDRWNQRGGGQWRRSVQLQKHPRHLIQHPKK